MQGSSRVAFPGWHRGSGQGDQIISLEGRKMPWHQRRGGGVVHWRFIWSAFPVGRRPCSERGLIDWCGHGQAGWLSPSRRPSSWIAGNPPAQGQVVLEAGRSGRSGCISSHQRCQVCQACQRPSGALRDPICGGLLRDSVCGHGIPGRADAVTGAAGPRAIPMEKEAGVCYAMA